MQSFVELIGDAWRAASPIVGVAGVGTGLIGMVTGGLGIWKVHKETAKAKITKAQAEVEHQKAQEERQAAEAAAAAAAIARDVALFPEAQGRLEDITSRFEAVKEEVAEARSRADRANARDAECREQLARTNARLEIVTDVAAMVVERVGVDDDDPLAYAIARLKASAPATPGSLNILLVEDDEATRRALARMISRMGHRVMPMSAAVDALVALDDRVDLVIADVLMPGLSGVDLLRSIRRTRPSLPVVLMSGDVHMLGKLAVDVPKITKPIDHHELVAVISNAVAARGAKANHE